MPLFKGSIKAKETGPIFAGVLLAHAGLFLLIQLTFQFTYDDVNEGMRTDKPIKATLVSPPLPPPEKEKEPILEDPGPPQQIETVSIEETVANQDVQEDNQTVTKVTEPAGVALPAPEATARLNLNAITQEVLSSMREDAVNSVAIDEVRRRQAALNTLWRPERPQPELTEDEKLIESITVDVNCDSTAGKWFMTIAGLMKGTMRCGPKPGIDQFIQNRLPGAQDPTKEGGEKD
ncbi:hypothetical protein DRW07_09905 [Alteromonas sediminis]|uniref:Uncharacterized protein n=1 Tax=Alteromonas sediminis TaxID=2259342 RepID=A0A3N5Y707_9ALTE|nr:hypothetical protein [Alteromonas sediminis]RPJ66399.1 hypothetical protein DRW07_09905 [Alteromonas sediminis]